MDRWDEGSRYDLFMGRWSRALAGTFVRHLDPPDGLRYLDVGCGTGALLEAVRAQTNPSGLVGIDPSPEFVALATTRLGSGVDVRVAVADHLPFEDATFDVVLSGLVLNFLPDPAAALVEWQRVTRPGGSVHAYVWDYAEGMGFLRHFWDAVVASNPPAHELDEGVRFPLCRPDRLADAFRRSGLESVSTVSLRIPTVFSDFADFWTPFLTGQGPAPGYVASLSDDGRRRLEKLLRARVPTEGDGSIRLTADAWTVTGTVG